MGDSELGFKENQEESVAGDGVGKGEEEEGEEFAFHGIQAVTGEVKSQTNSSSDSRKAI